MDLAPCPVLEMRREAVRKTKTLSPLRKVAESFRDGVGSSLLPLSHHQQLCPETRSLFSGESKGFSAKHNRQTPHTKREIKWPHVC